MIPEFAETIRSSDPDSLSLVQLEVLQVNLGNHCNQSCAHCHIEAGPDGSRWMGVDTIDQILDFLRQHPGLTLDITGGAPETNPHFTYLVDHGLKLTRQVLVRTNLTILLQKGMEWLAPFYRDRDLVLFSSLPCYLEENVDRQRGKNTYSRSIAALKQLNSFGYGTSRELNLVYNPQGPCIAPRQEDLEKDYHRYLQENYGITFSHLVSITNAPLGRFRRDLKRKRLYDTYINLLQRSYNPVAASRIMCRSLISVGCDGVLYNCDFNGAAGLPVCNDGDQPLRIAGLGAALEEGIAIRTAVHCFSCTAGFGSSCAGSLSD